MFDEKTLRDLASTEATGPILSVYLNVDPTQRTPDEYKLKLRELLKKVESKADPADTEAVKRYLDLEYDWSGRGLVIFSRQAEDIWYAISLSVPVRSGITVAQKPHISPLVELTGLHGRYVAALIDRQGGHFFLFEMGDLIAQADVQGEDVRRTRRGRGSSMVGMMGGGPASGRKEAEVVQRNLRETAEALVKFCQKHHPRRLLLGGAERTVAQFQEELPGHLRDIVVGTFALHMEANEVEVRERAQEILQALQERRRTELVETVITAAAKGSNGVIRLDETLSMAYEGRIQVLVLGQHYHAPGFRCNGCGYLTTQTLEQCPFCGGMFVEIPDAAEAVVSQVIEKGGSVEVVPDELMEEAKIGALLRY